MKLPEMWTAGRWPYRVVNWTIFGKTFRPYTFTAPNSPDLSPPNFVYSIN
jgi:hypothetical protein